MKQIDIHLSRVLLNAFLLMLAVAVTAPVAFAQEARSLTIRDGHVYIDGDLVSPGELPENLDLEHVDLRFRFSGENEPMVTINGELYVLEEDRLRPAQKISSVYVDTQPDGNDHIVVRFRNEDDPHTRHFDDEGNPRLDIPVQAYTAYLDSIEFGGILQDAAAIQEHVREMTEGKVEIRMEAMQEQMHEARLQAQEVNLQALETLREARLQLPRRELQAYFGRLQDHHGDLFGQLQNEWRLEAKSRRLARRARETEDDERREELEQELREVLEEAFELKLENRRREVEALEEQLQELREELQDSQQEREDIIDARMESLLQWW